MRRTRNPGPVILDGLRPVDVCGQCEAPRPRCHCVVSRGRALAKVAPRWKSRHYLKFVRGLPCSVEDCAIGAHVEAAHFGPRAAGRKVHDFMAVPLCSVHHGQAHQEGRAWEHYQSVNLWQLRTIAAAIVSGVLECSAG